MALDPANAEARAAAAALQATRAHRLELDYDFQHVNAAPEEAHLGTIEVNARVSDAVRIFARGQAQRAFGFDEQRAGGGVEIVTRRAWLRAGVLIGADTAFLPESEGFVEASIARGRVRGRWKSTERISREPIWGAGPGLAVALTGGPKRRPLLSRTSHLGRQPMDDRYRRARRRRSSRGAAAAWRRVYHGIDRLDWLTLDRVAIEADTLRSNLLRRHAHTTFGPATRTSPPGGSPGASRSAGLSFVF